MESIKYFNAIYSITPRHILLSAIGAHCSAVQLCAVLCIQCILFHSYHPLIAAIDRFRAYTQTLTAGH